VRVESNTHIPIDVHTRDNDINNVECELVIESSMIAFSYRPSSQLLEFFTMIHWEVSGFSSFSGSIEVCPDIISY